MPETLTARDRNRTLLARQLLLERAETSVARATERVAGIQAQYAPSAYIGLWTRLGGFARNELTAALTRRSVVQGTLMRGTIHLVSRRDYPALAAGVRAARRAWWVRTTRGDAGTMRALARRVRTILADGPMPRREITARLGIGSTAWNGVSLWVDMVRIPPSGTWERRSADLYGLAEAWVGAHDVPEDDGLELVVRRYLAGFGPSTPKEVSGWSGVPLATIGPVLERMRLRAFRDEDGGDLLDVRRGPIVDGDAPAPVRFLPTWDATLLIHERGTQILPERFRPRVFNTKTPHSVPTFLVDGHVAGTWRFGDDRIRIEAFERLPRGARQALEDEAERLRAFHVEGR
jgi:Winged helix DNA-binding domain